MDIEAIRNRLAELQITIPGVIHAFARATRTINGADMPLFVNYSSAAQYDYRSYGEGWCGITRRFRMRLYVQPKAAEIDDDVETACEPFFSSVFELFSSQDALDLPDVQSAVLIEDSGVLVVEDKYIAIDFLLDVLVIEPYVRN